MPPSSGMHCPAGGTWAPPAWTQRWPSSCATRPRHVPSACSMLAARSTCPLILLQACCKHGAGLTLIPMRLSEVLLVMEADCCGAVLERCMRRLAALVLCCGCSTMRFGSASQARAKVLYNLTVCSSSPCMGLTQRLAWIEVDSLHPRAEPLKLSVHSYHHG